MSISFKDYEILAIPRYRLISRVTYFTHEAKPILWSESTPDFHKNLILGYSNDVNALSIHQALYKTFVCKFWIYHNIDVTN